MVRFMHGNYFITAVYQYNFAETILSMVMALTEQKSTINVAVMSQNQLKNSGTIEKRL